MVIVTVGFIFFDLVTGIFEAAYKGKINSTKLRAGLYHKGSELLSILGAYLAEIGLEHLHTSISLPLLGGVCSYICLLEAISILENLGEVNPEMGKFFSKYLEKLKGEKDEKRD